MAVYCDRLSFRSGLQLLRLRANGKVPRADVRLLDPLNGWSARSCARLLGFAGFRFRELQFMVGELRTADGESARTAGKKAAFHAAHQCAKQLLSEVPALARRNRAWTRNTVLVHLARCMWPSVDACVIRLLTVEAFARDDDDRAPTLVLGCPADLEPRWLEAAIVTPVTVRWYRSFAFSFRAGRVAGLLMTTYRSALRLWRRHGRKLTDTVRPSVLALQEDDVSLDRSVRGQPHWYLPDSAPLPFQLLVLQRKHVDEMPIDSSELARHDVRLLPDPSAANAISVEQLTPARRVVLQELASTAWREAFGAVFSGSSATGVARSRLSLLFAEARDLAALCISHDVRAFVTCENQARAADGMALVAARLGLPRVSYQYSNLNHFSLPLLTSADLMLTFSPHFHDLWEHEAMRPGRFIDVGYVFDSSLRYFRDRSQQHRRRLEEAGARFVICFFDESVQTDKYGFISQASYEQELAMLVAALVVDSSIGIILKPQFQKNMRIGAAGIVEAIQAAESTGRLLILANGAHRNNVFPAEAALASDLAIGHAIGATAALESACAGVRTVLINPYGLKSRNDALYSRAQIQLPSLACALAAVQAYRAGSPEYQRLGDWSPIIDELDPFRDGRSGERMRAVLESVVRTGEAPRYDRMDPAMPRASVEVPRVAPVQSVSR